MLGKKRIADLPVLSREEARRTTRVLVIDDDPNSFPIEMLQTEGYAVDHWSTVKDLQRLEDGRYDIIILDIQGVATHYSSADGLGILEHLKTRNPAQIIIAFSGRTYDLSKTQFWRLADDALAKPVDATTAKRVIDDMIERKRTPAHYWAVAAAALRAQGLGDRELAKLEDRVAKAILSRNEAAVRETVFAVLGHVDQAVRIGTILVRILSLVKH